MFSVDIGNGWIRNISDHDRVSGAIDKVLALWIARKNEGTTSLDWRQRRDCLQIFIWHRFSSEKKISFHLKKYIKNKSGTVEKIIKKASM